jgi:ferredoxin
VLSVLRAQRFYPDPKAAPSPHALAPFAFRFEDCASAVQAFRERLPDLVETVKAIAMAELEVQGRYVGANHDAFFDRFADQSLQPDDLALFPDYLVCIPTARNTAPENADLMGMLSSGLPVKVLVETGDLLEEAAIGIGHFAFGVRSTRLAMTATGLGGVFVVQAPSSNLFALRHRIAAGFGHRGPALFSVFAGLADPAPGLPTYLTAAAAMESRAFPTFSYDPHAGDNQAARFSFENNPQPEADWPKAPFEYADEQLQRIFESTAFTFADFVLCDRRYARHFAVVPRDRWNAAMRPVADWLDLGEKEAGQSVPYVLAIDSGAGLHRVAVDARLMDAVRRNRVLWRRLQEQGGIHNSHAERVLKRERAVWDEEKRRELDAARGEAAAAPKAQQPEPAAKALVAAAPEATGPADSAPPSDDPWIETARCTTCNECQIINDRMFAYNDNKQAYIKDPDAGTFRQLVEAAESCQVAIIHPGKPRNPREPGLAELMKRVEAFH